ncbi:RNA methyltransferase [Pseudomarimonas arenosa]|uniref:tRNA (cytidine/uridine-2'-O-)-methyltransferase TrmJ n=1 Tax=Pseudomarimonas arenosa TaxID=2774145 RepID=A0AAW3ZS54_9GAMM|nr:RNA methyltransferase [Pseudomarimonas arenosa]MBD8527399.1 RNA methyltransferase [Pseudomarimonas arenosa]
MTAASLENAALTDSLRFVLVGTSHPGNIGSAARAMKTMGLQHLQLAACECDPFAGEAKAMASGAEDLINAAPQWPSLADAVADSSLVVGTTARVRHVRMPEWSPRQAAAEMLAELRRGGRVSLVFGRERTGLSNDELQLCHAAVHIPTSTDFSSLNLAAAVQVLAYELRCALLESLQPRNDSASDEDSDTPAEHAQIERFFDHLDRALHAIDFHKGRSPVTVMRRLRRLFLKARPSERELRILHGILADAERMAGLAQQDR